MESSNHSATSQGFTPKSLKTPSECVAESISWQGDVPPQSDTRYMQKLWRWKGVKATAGQLDDHTTRST